MTRSIARRLTDARHAGISAEGCWRVMGGALDKQAEEEGWRPASLAASKADVALALREVYGDAATEFIFSPKGA
jgi:hypothetical protein